MTTPVETSKAVSITLKDGKLEVDGGTMTERDKVILLGRAAARIFKVKDLGLAERTLVQAFQDERGTMMSDSKSSVSPQKPKEKEKETV